jgi:putative nucleotidyltransferase with HDIG domain
MRVFRRRRLVKRGLTTAVKRVSGERHRVLVYLDRGIVPRAITGVLLAAVLTFIIAKGRDLPRLYLGQVAKQDIVATRDFEYHDEAKRQQVVAEERAKVPPILRLDEARINEQFTAFADFFARMGQPAGGPAPAEASASGEGSDAADAEQAERRLEQEAARLFPTLDSEQVSEVASHPDYAADVERLRGVLLGLAPVRVVSQPGYELPAPYERLNEAEFRQRRDAAIAKAFEGEEQRLVALMKGIAEGATSFVEDAETRRLLRDRRAAAVPAQYTQVRRLETIIAEGEKVTSQHIVELRAYSEALKAAVSRATRYSYRALVGLVVVLMLGLCAVYMWQFEPRVFRYNSKLALIGLVSLAALALTKGLSLIEPPNEWWRDVLRFPVLLALPAMVVAMAFPLRLAFFVTLVLSVISGMHYDAMSAEMMINPTFVLLGLVGGSAAALYARTIRYRKEFVRTGAMIGLLNFLVIALLGMLGGLHYSVLLRQGLGGLAAGIGATTLAWVFLPALETLFHITTNVSLVELGDSNHPLLRRMVMEAPGTYHHSLVVGNLAEAGAEAIGGNPLLARVGALYHDIGKLKKPDYFSENEQQARSRHDTLIPSMSSLIITSHVKDGIDLGYKYRLKPAILDIIREHHGTSLVYYFYKRAAAVQAAAQANGESAGVDEADYRYPGPKPQTKESAIIMLADAVEAAARAMEKPTASKIKTLIRELILARFNDGQLDESDLTLRDLHRIQEAFTHIILGTLHQRVKYPKEGEPAEDEEAEPETAEAEATGAANRPD